MVMVDVEPVTATGNDTDSNDADRADAADLAVFVDRLAAAGSDRPTTLAKGRIRGLVEAGCPPPGLRHLAEALAASAAERSPAPRLPSGDPRSVVTAMGVSALVVLEDVDTAAVAATVAALLADGRRVVVTAARPAALTAVRDTLPDAVGDRVVDRLPTLPAGELRELRRLLATSTEGRRARLDQQLPPATGLPTLSEVALLCGRAGRSTGSVPSAGSVADLVPALLADLDHDRRAAVTSVARGVSAALGALQPRADRVWAWSLLSDLVHGRLRPELDRMLEATAQAVVALERAQAAPTVAVTGSLPDDAVDLLLRYQDFLEAGGRSRQYLRSQAQRDVEPVLRQVRVDGRMPQTQDEVGAVVEHLDLGERLGRVDAGCAELGIDPPRGAAELVTLTDGLVAVAAAARSVGALRHDVLFIAPGSPLTVPDVETAEQVAGAIGDYAEHGSAADAAQRLDVMADRLSTRFPVTVMSPEHDLAVAALRDRDTVAYAAALDGLEAARREVRDETRKAALLRRLGEGSPRLAKAWTVLGGRGTTAFGLACLLPMDALLSAVPAPDSADVVVVLEAAQLGVERLLLTAVAPRMIAAVGPGPRRDDAPSLLHVLRRAAAVVIRGLPAGGGGRAGGAGSARSGGAPDAVPVGRVES